jgi:predicted transcriptional regulator
MNSSNNSTVRIDSNLLEAVKELAEKSDMSIANVLSAAVRYALEHAAIESTTRTIEVHTVVFK